MYYEIRNRKAWSFGNKVKNYPNNPDLKSFINEYMCIQFEVDTLLPFHLSPYWGVKCCQTDRHTVTIGKPQATVVYPI